MKKILLSAMMIMAMMCATTNASAQDHKCDKNKKLSFLHFNIASCHLIDCDFF